MMEIQLISSGSVTLSNLAGAETLNKSGNISTNSPNVGSFSTSDIAVSSLSLSDGTGIAQTTLSVEEITQQPLPKKTLGLTGSKVYDATTMG